MQINNIKDWKKLQDENRRIPNFLQVGAAFPGPPKNTKSKNYSLLRVIIYYISPIVKPFYRHIFEMHNWGVSLAGYFYFSL